MATPAKTETEQILGEYEGVQVTSTSVKTSGLDARLTEAVVLQPVVIDANGFAYVIAKVRPAKHAYAMGRDAVGMLASAELEQGFEIVGAMFTEADDDTVAAVQDMIDRVREAREERKSGQRAFTVVTDKGTSTRKAPTKSGKDAATGKD